MDQRNWIDEEVDWETRKDDEVEIVNPIDVN
jgi:hypothetical protein